MTEHRYWGTEQQKWIYPGDADYESFPQEDARQRRHQRFRDAIDAYDAARCAANGSDIAKEGMSERNKESIAPMISAAIRAAEHPSFATIDRELRHPKTHITLVSDTNGRHRIEIRGLMPNIDALTLGAC